MITQTNATPEEAAAEVARQGTYEKQLKRWKALMRGSDDTLMPRFVEVHIENDHGGVVGDAVLQQKYDDKKALRATKP